MIIILTAFIIISLITFPDAMLNSALSTLILWLSKVFPSLFPFMVCSSILMKCGGADLLGIILQPIMKPIFKLRGVCSFPLVMGMLSGYPMGAKLTANLYEENKISLEEATHLMYFTNNPGPLFLIGTVGTSFFNSPEIGYLMLISCFSGAILSGIIYGIIKKNQEYNFKPCSKKVKIHNLSFFEILSISISNSLVTVGQIGGFMIFFGILITALDCVGFFKIWNTLFSFVPLSELFLKGVFSGIIEMTTGVYALSQSPDNTNVRLLFSCVLVSLGGCSILGQTFAIIKNLPIKKSHYIMAKVYNSMISSCIFYFLYKNLYSIKTTEVFRNFHTTTSHILSIELHLFFCIGILLLFIFLNILNYFKHRKTSP